VKEADMRATRNYLICAAFLFAVGGARIAAGADLREPGATVMETLTPAEAKAGDIVTVHGESLDAMHVKAVFLTDRKNETEVEIISQGEKTLRFKMPKVEPGRWHVAILLVRDNLFLEEPVFVVVLPEKG
jgi:hypothetical protein